ncbi:hypothetical protein [Risungbinella massiliensis]|uniref:hypothetical protein n=1 Tax=Risungbinella massiliensis TaxID=1329796 RepID=UPI0005CBFF68|nr:hypothetical protein [Risungbinella massiliensis]
MKSNFLIFSLLLSGTVILSGCGLVTTQQMQTLPVVQEWEDSTGTDLNKLAIFQNPVEDLSKLSPFSKKEIVPTQKELSKDSSPTSQKEIGKEKSQSQQKPQNDNKPSKEKPNKKENRPNNNESGKKESEKKTESSSLKNSGKKGQTVQKAKATSSPSKNKKD